MEEGEYTAVMGESGSGKTTLLNLLASFDRPTSGDIILNGLPFRKIQDKDLAVYRRKNLGFVFQDFNLLDTLSVRDNIFLPLVLAGEKTEEMKNGCHLLSRCFGSPICWTNFRTKFPGVKNNGRRSQEHLLQSPSSFWRMNRPGLWIPGPPMNCCICLSRSIRRGRQSLW